MNPSELATKMLQWEQQRRELDALEDEIKAAVRQANISAVSYTTKGDEHGHGRTVFNR
jgi:hypothetical protein